MSSVALPVDGTERLLPLGPLADAAARAGASGRPVLLSFAERVPHVDPLEALAAVAGVGEHEGLAAARMFWSRPADGFAMAAVGSVATIAPEGADRFREADRAWAELLSNAVVDVPAEERPGVGPTLLGGFSFDPAGPRSARWRPFPATLLTLPRLQLAVVDGECWLTTNVMVDAEGQLDLGAAALTALRRRLLAAPAAPLAPAAASSRSLETRPARPASEWRELVQAAVAEIRGGGFEKVVLAREVRASAGRPLEVVAALRHLRAAHPDCYVFGCWRGESAFLGASPERLVRLDGREVAASSLAGSVRRGATAGDDAALAAGLLASEKDRQEHEVVRRSLCENLAELCDDVSADEEPSLLSLPQVHHLHTPVRARLRAGHSLLDLVARLHPTPAVGGAPREAALRFIREHEQLDRGWYAAPIGWIQPQRGEFAVGLRSALVSGAEASLFAGCGVVADSDADEEYAESLIKLRPMELALGAALADGDDAGRGEG